jgi:hypothetical protein
MAITGNFYYLLLLLPVIFIAGYCYYRSFL